MLANNSNVKNILKEFENQKVFFVDIETSGLDLYENDYILGVGICSSNRKSYYFPFRHKENNLDMNYMKELIHLLNNSKMIVGYNIKFDLSGLSKEGFKLTDQELIDVIVMSRLCSEGRFDDLDLVSSCKRFISVNYIDNKDELKQFIKSNKIKFHKDIDPDFMSDYCCKDVQGTYDLYQILSKKILETRQTKTFSLEKETTRTLFFIENRGMIIDPKYCAESNKYLEDKIKAIEDSVYDITKEYFTDRINLLSNKQLTEMFHMFGIKSPLFSSKTGNDLWNEKAMVLIDHPIAGLIREYRTLAKLKNTYFEPFLGKNILHPTFKNWGTITGRLSCVNPNLQNIPRFNKSLYEENEVIDEEKKKQILAMVSSRLTKGGNAAGGSTLASWGFTGDENYEETLGNISVRRLFLSRKDYTLYSIDFSQLEIMIFISYLRNSEIFDEMKKNDFDFHTFVCKLVFGYDKDHPNFKFWRQIAKAITFGLIYGMGNDLLAVQMGKSVEEAKEFRKLYFSKLKGSKKFIDDVVKTLRTRGYVYNRYDRRYVTPRDKEYAAVNYLIQGTAGDLVKDRMNKVSRYLENRKSKIVNQIHDELLIEVYNEENDEVINEIRRIMMLNEFNIPLRTDVTKCFPSWAHKKDE